MSGVDERPTTLPTPEQMRQFALTISPAAVKAAADYEAAMARLARTASSVVERSQSTFEVMRAFGIMGREHWTRHHPRPLAIDGHAYRRRQRARRRRT